MTTDFKSELFFSACLLFRSIHNGRPADTDIWEESVILLRADSEAQAVECATRIGGERAFSYAVAHDDVVAVEFIAVQRVFKIEDSLMSNGAEVFSRHLRGTEATSLLQPLSDGSALAR